MIPGKLRPYVCQDLIRVGSKNDGGYVLSETALLNADYLISMGLGFNWHFEKDFLAVRKVPARCYDPTMNKGLLASNALESAKRLSFASALKFLILHHRYDGFFSENVRHVAEWIGDGSNETTNLSGAMIGVSARNIFFKIDIEGGEYAIMDELIEAQDRVCGFVVELHRVNENMDRILQFLASLHRHRMVHLHGNNYAGLSSEGIPNVLELSFVRDDLFVGEERQTNDYYIPSLDRPNKRRAKDYINLEFDL